MDDIDKGNHQAELTLQAYIERVRRRVEREVTPTGYCLNCEEQVGPHKLFCDTTCRDDYEKRERLRAKFNRN